MKVKKLIKKLQKCNPDSQVEIFYSKDDCKAAYFKIENVEEFAFSDSVDINVTKKKSE